MAQLPSPQFIGNDLMTLKEASEVFFRGKIKVHTLRAARDRGELMVERLGNKDFVTPDAINEWREKCRVNPKVQGSICVENDATLPGNSHTNQCGLSGTGQKQLARDAALATAQKLKDGSLTTSVKNTTPASTAEIIQIKSV